MKRLITARNDNLLSVWQVVDVPSRAYIGDGLLPADLLQDISPAPSQPHLVGYVLPHLKAIDLVLADRSVDGWKATLDGVELKQVSATELRWRIPALASGQLEVTNVSGDRSAALLLSGLAFLIFLIDRKSTRLNSSHIPLSRMPSSA